MTGIWNLLAPPLKPPQLYHPFAESEYFAERRNADVMTTAPPKRDGVHAVDLLASASGGPEAVKGSHSQCRHFHPARTITGRTSITRRQSYKHKLAVFMRWLVWLPWPIRWDDKNSGGEEKETRKIILAKSGRKAKGTRHQAHGAPTSPASRWICMNLACAPGGPAAGASCIAAGCWPLGVWLEPVRAAPGTHECVHGAGRP
jgi:hypothetical protein